MAWLPWGAASAPLHGIGAAQLQAIYSITQTLRETLLFKHLLNILLDWRLKLQKPKKASEHLQNSLVQDFSDITLPSS